MNQAHVEQSISRLVTDDHWRLRHGTAPEALVDGLAPADGLEVAVGPRWQRLAVRR